MTPGTTTTASGVRGPAAGTAAAYRSAVGDDRGFQLVVVAVSDYPDPPGALPSTASADRVARRLAEWGGRETSARPVPATTAAVRARLRAWTTGQVGPRSSLLYWVGHGWDNGDELLLLTSDSEQPYDAANAVPAAELAGVLRADWERRSALGDARAWTVAVFDCCGSSVGITNIVHELTKVPARRPERLALLAVSSRGASFAGRFADQLEAAFDALTPNDTEVLVRDLLDAVADRLGDDAAAEGRLAKGAVLARQAPAAVVTMNVDALAELRRVVGELPPAVRSHFLVKAQGGEVGELAWYFSGREAETRELAAWLRSDASGLRVVTGEPGAGKSALLGHLVTLADGALVAAMQRAGLVGEVAGDLRPPEGVFDAVLHLTGMRLEEVVGAFPAGRGVDEVLDRLRTAGRPFTVLADALDEAQEPELIARSLLRPVAQVPGVKVLVGTRRSLEEGPDRPPPARHELLEALGVVEDECLVVRRDPEAKAAYVRKRLAQLPHVDDLVARITGPDQPFLFARLATAELLARPPLDPADPALDRLLAGGYRGLYLHAVERLAAEEPAARPLLQALAVARGRGLPRNGRVWATVAGVFNPLRVDIGEEAVDQVVAAAAPYLTLDGDGGQSVYRLAHQTFRDGTSQAITDPSVATALLGLVEAAGGWEGANPYVVRYLPEYLALEPDRLEALVTDARWLARALDLLGADGLADLLAASGRVSFGTAVEPVAKAVRRARVALGYDPAQLAAQLHGRLHAHRRQAVGRLVAALPEVAPPVWLRARTPHLRWQAELETTQTFPASVRALAFGTVGGRTVLAVGAGHDVYLWDPRTARAATVLANDGLRVTAVAVGGDVLATGAGYERRVWLRTATTGARLAFDPPYVRVSLASAGTLAVGEGVVVGAARGGVEVWDRASGDSLQYLDADWPAVASTGRGVVVAEMDHAYRLRVRDLASGAPIGPVIDDGGRPPTAIAVGEAGGRVLVAQAFRHGEVGVWDAATGDLVGRPDAGMLVRALTLGEIDGRAVVAAAEETDEDHSQVVLREPEADSPEQDWHGNRGTLLAVASTARGLLALTELGDPRSIDPGTGRLTHLQEPRSDVSRVILGVRDPDAVRIDSPVVWQSAGSATSLYRNRPEAWPPTSRAVGTVRGRLTWAVGSYEGVVWLFDAETRQLVGGPFADVSEVVLVRRKKTSRRQIWVTGVALGWVAGKDVLARAYDGAVTLHDLASGDRIAGLEPPAYRALSVSLGEVGGQPALATGGEGGIVAVWDLGSGDRRAARPAQVTLDRPVTGVWLVRGAEMVVARTNDRAYHVFDVVGRWTDTA
jgi:WD40 repeat protein